MVQVEEGQWVKDYSYILGRETKTNIARWSIFPSQSPANLEVWQIKAAGVRFRIAVNI